MEHSTLWDRQDLLVQVIDAGHRQGGRVPRVDNKEVVYFPTFAPLALGTVIDRARQHRFPEQIVTRSIASEMKQHPEGRDEIFPGDPRFVPVRAVISRWAPTFQRPKTIRLPKGVVMRCSNNWYALTAIGDALGYGATLRAAAIAVETANFDLATKLDEDLYEVFKQQQADGLWTHEIVQATRNGAWALGVADERQALRHALPKGERLQDSLEGRR